MFLFGGALGAILFTLSEDRKKGLTFFIGFIIGFFLLCQIAPFGEAYMYEQGFLFFCWMSMVLLALRNKATPPMGGVAIAFFLFVGFGVCLS